MFTVCYGKKPPVTLQPQKLTQAIRIPELPMTYFICYQVIPYYLRCTMSHLGIPNDKEKLLLGAFAVSERC